MAPFPRCVYCNCASEFIVKLRNDTEGVVGTLNVCETCRHMIQYTPPFDFRMRDNKYTDKLRITDVPPPIELIPKN